MNDRYFTLAAWHVREGKEEEFLRLWREELAAAFRAVDPEAHGTLIQSLQEPRLYYSFGPWETLERMQAARSDPGVRAALGKLVELCEVATPGAYRQVLVVP